LRSSSDNLVEPSSPVSRPSDSCTTRLIPVISCSISATLVSNLESEGLETGEEGSTRLSELDLKTVSLPTRHPVSPLEDGERRRGSNILSSVGNVGRSFSSGLVSAPRRVGSFAGGLYRPKDKEGGEEEKVLLSLTPHHHRRSCHSATLFPPLHPPCLSACTVQRQGGWRGGKSVAEWQDRR
jgi:hypothetical protein